MTLYFVELDLLGAAEADTLLDFLVPNVLAVTVSSVTLQDIIEVLSLDEVQARGLQLVSSSQRHDRCSVGV